MTTFQFPLDSCSTENGNHLLFAALPCSRELKWQFSFVADCFCNLSSNKEMTNLGSFYFFFPPKTSWYEAWNHLAPSFINILHSLFYLVLLSLLLAQKMLSEQHPAPPPCFYYLLVLSLCLLQSVISWRRTEFHLVKHHTRNLFLLVMSSF